LTSPVEMRLRSNVTLQGEVVCKQIETAISQLRAPTIGGGWPGRYLGTDRLGTWGERPAYRDK
jgi:hypothetical protein